jgi:hypothetical protein
VTDSFSRLIVYVDESGDHGPVSPEFPVFVLAFCIFDKKAYANEATSLMHRLKFKHFGHDAVVLHEREIRKSLKPFGFLQNSHSRPTFLEDVSKLVELAQFTLIAAVIDKDKLRQRYPEEEKNPYHLAMQFGLERIELHRRSLGDRGLLHVIFEGRGKKEDSELELSFQQTCGRNALHERLEMTPLFVHKQANHCGLQLADLVARPIGVHAIHPQQPNRAYDVLEKKFRRSPEGRIEGWGLKCFP